MAEWFENDWYLQHLPARLDEYDVVSFDVFDTLLFRTVYEPGEVFERIPAHLRADRPEYLDMPPAVFASLRALAERRAREAARERGWEDVTLEEIYREIAFDSRPQDTLRAELAAEAESCYLNPNMEAFLRHCHARGKAIALVSDFYFPEPLFRELLERVGLDMGLVSHFVVSCEFRQCKSGGLLGRLLERLPGMDPARVLHIGDNWTADVRPARELGISALWYGVVPKSRDGIPDMERRFFGGTLGELASLRALAMESQPLEPLDGDAAFWRRTGAGVLGPVYALFAEWVVDQCQRRGLSQALCFMREGQLLAEFIRRAAAHRGVDLRVEPLYISRRAVQLFRYEEVGEAVIDEFLMRAHIRVEDLLANFYLDCTAAPLAPLADKTLRACKEDGTLEEIRAYLCQPDTLSAIQMETARQRALFVEYASGLLEEGDAATVDIGYAGTIQAGMDGAFAGEGGARTFYHLILAGGEGNEKNLLSGVRLLGWLGYGGARREALRDLQRRTFLLEALLNANEGSTLSYARTGNGVRPVLEQSALRPADAAHKALCWEGMLLFQQYWLAFSGPRRGLRAELTRRQDEITAILRRLGEMPRYEEAALLGELPFEDSVKFSYNRPICTGEDTLRYKETGDPETYLAEVWVPFRHAYWPDAVVERCHPGRNRARHLAEKMGPNFLKTGWRQYLYGPEAVSKRIALYGAGKVGRMIADALVGSKVPFFYIVDKDERLQGQAYNGARIISPAASVGQVDLYIIGVKEGAGEIREELTALWKNAPPLMRHYREIIEMVKD